MIRVCIAGATGWAGSELARAASNTSDLSVVSAVSRTHAGKQLGHVLGESDLSAPIFASVTDALSVSSDVLVEYTTAASAKANITAALKGGRNVVVGTSGLSESDFSDIDAVARRWKRGVLACGNFALTAVLLQRFAEAAARIIPQWEIIDYASDAKRDAPSGTVRELAARLAKVRAPTTTIPISETVGSREVRGGTLDGSQVHSVRLPGYVISAEIVFGMADQRLTIRHDSGTSARPYVDGALMAIRKVSTLAPGLHRGLDAVLDVG